MSDYVLSSESTADLSREHLERRRLSCICYPFELDGVMYRDDLGVTIPYDRFYAAMAEGAETKTARSMPTSLRNILNPFYRAERMFCTCACPPVSPA